MPLHYLPRKPKWKPHACSAKSEPMMISMPTAMAKGTRKYSAVFSNHVKEMAHCACGAYGYRLVAYGYRLVAYGHSLCYMR